MSKVTLKTSRGIYGITSENLHYWWNIAGTQFLISNEDTKRDTNKISLWSFDSVDEAINYLYFNGFKQSARDISNHEKESK